MASLFWSGKLTFPMKLLINSNNLLSIFTGSYRDISGMKTRVKKGYEGEFTEHVHYYDKFGYQRQYQSALIQLENIDLNNYKILDVGCGTGALTHAAFENGAQSALCGDIAYFMLKQAKHSKNRNRIRSTFCQLDADYLPFSENTFDSAISGMTFGTLPNQKLVLEEMIRVTKPGGLICIGAHGPSHYWEAIDATLRCINKRYVLGYRFEWWPRGEQYIFKLLKKSGLNNIKVRQAIWKNEFKDGYAAYDFFSSISSSWWYAKFPPEERIKDSNRTREYFKKKNIKVITDDIVIGSGYKK